MATAGSPLKVYGIPEGQAAVAILVGHEDAHGVVLLDEIAVLEDLAQPRIRPPHLPIEDERQHEQDGADQK